MALAPITSRLVVSEGRFQRVLVGFMVAGFAALLVAGLAAAWVTRQNQSHVYWVNHTYEVEVAIADAGRILEQGETTRRGYLVARQSTFLTTARDSFAELARATDHVARLTRDNPRQQDNIRALRGLIATQLARERRSVDLVAAGAGDRAATEFVAELTDKQMRAIRDRFAAMANEERRLLAARDEDQRASVRTFYGILGIAGVVLAIVAATSLFVVLRFTRDLTASRDTLRALNDTLEQRVAARTAELTRANDEIQRFAYIVSHDLRSPLVNVMGFTSELEEATEPLTELVDRVEADAPALLSAEARRAAREELPEAIGFIRTSTRKMDRLIAAILKLSREGRRVIAPEPLDMDALVGGIRDSLRHRLDHEGTRLVIETPLPPVTSDRVSVEQILSNLIENAVKYVQPGRPGEIVVRGTAGDGRVAYEVVDNGRGIAPADRERVFELFRRSGAQDQPGEGIGLAHVRPLAYRLGGTVDIRSELGQGSIFRLTLPAEFQDMTR